MEDLLKKILEQNEIIIEQNKQKIQLLKEQHLELEQLTNTTKSFSENMSSRLGSVIYNMAYNTDVISNNMLSLLSKNDLFGFQTARGGVEPVQLSRKNGYISHSWDSNIEGGNVKRKDKVIACSIPKSGTHIIEYILRSLGFISRYSSQQQNYTNTNIFEAKANFRSQSLFWNHAENINRPNRLSLLKEGMVDIGHFTFKLNSYVTSEKIILAKRHLKHQLVSFYKHEINGWTHTEPLDDWEKLPFSEEGFLKYLDSKLFHNHFKYFFEQLLPWYKTYPNNVVKFEDLTSSDEKNQLIASETISRILNISIEEIFHALKQSIGVKTKTYSGKVDGGFDELWTDKVDNLYYSLGYDKLNKELGYE